MGYLHWERLRVKYIDISMEAGGLIFLYWFGNNLPFFLHIIKKYIGVSSCGWYFLF